MRGFDGKATYNTCGHPVDGYAISRIAQAQEAAAGNFVMANRALESGNVTQYNMYMGYAADWARQARIEFGIEEKVFTPVAPRRRRYRR